MEDIRKRIINGKITFKEAATKYMMEKLVENIYSVYTENFKNKEYTNEDSVITLEQQDDGKWFVTDIKGTNQNK